MLTPFLTAARRVFSERLFFTNVCLRTGFMTFGDALIQFIDLNYWNTATQFDFDRSKRAMILGASLGVVGHHWYRFLDNRYPGKGWPSLRKKLIAEMIATPAFAVFIFGVSGFLKGHAIRQISSDLYRNLPIIYLVDWALYVPAQAINFTYVDRKYRVLFVCGFALLYDMFLAFLINYKCAHAKKKLKAAEETSTTLKSSK